MTEEANPPSDEHFLAIVDKLLPRWRLFAITLEQGALRSGEALALRWGDVDASGNRLRLPRTATKTGKSRWVQLPTTFGIAGSLSGTRRAYRLASSLRGLGTPSRR